MADDNNRRPFRPGEPYSRPAAPGSSGSGSDPLAELARLIGQNDPFAEFGRGGRQQAPASDPAQEWLGQGVTPSYLSPPGAPPRASAADPYGAHPPADQPPFGAPHYEPSAPGGHDLYHADHEHPASGTPPPAAGGYDPNAYYQDKAQGSRQGSRQGSELGTADDEDVYDDVPPRRRISIIAIAGIVALAVLGTAGAVGYRALFGSSASTPPPVIKADATPSKVVPSNNAEPQSSKLIYDRVGDRGQGEKLVSREEQPVEMKDKPPQAIFPGAIGGSNTAPPAAATPAAAAAATGNEPKKIRTVAIRPDQPQSGPDPTPTPARAAAVPAKPIPTTRVAAVSPAAATAADTADTSAAPTPAPALARPAPVRPAPVQQVVPPPSNVPLSLNPDAGAAPVRTASAPARTASAPTAPTRIAPPAAATVAATTAATGSYAVQVSAQRSEADAEASFRALQGKFPSQLGTRQPIIRRADLGDKGIYFRAMVGPFANAGEANELCSSLKSAGGQCIVQKN